MRLKIIFKVLNPGAKLPFSYKYEMSSWLYKALGTGNPELTTWLHNHGYTEEHKRFKFFTFSDLRIPRGGYQVAPPYMKIWADEVSALLSFYVDQTAEAMIIAAFHNQQLDLGDKFHQLKLQIQELTAKHVHISSETLTLKTNAPLIVTRPADLQKGERHAQYLSPNHEDYEHFFCQNLIAKYTAALNHQLIEPVDPFSNISFKLLPGKVAKKGITIKAHTPAQTKVIGYQFNFELTAPKPLLRLGILSGFGEKNAMGFGSVEINEKK